eukprot:906-Heterococcus_DN1.PRE.3
MFESSVAYSFKLAQHARGAGQDCHDYSVFPVIRNTLLIIALSSFKCIPGIHIIYHTRHTT